MRVKVLLLAAALTVSVAGTASASEISDAVVRQLRSFGYSSMKVRHTLLGRIRITAVRDGRTREIVLNRWSGDILSDRFIDEEGPTGILDYGNGSEASSGSSPKASSGHEDQEDGEDQEDEEDEVDETDEADEEDEEDSGSDDENGSEDEH